MSWLSSLFKSKTKLKDTRTREATEADQILLDTLKKGTPEIPTEQVAGLSENEQMAQELAQQYAQQPGEGLAAIRKIVNEPYDITQDPTISALLESVGRKGDLAANRLSRSLMLRGGRGGAGRDMLGRQVTGTQQEMLSTLAPYAEASKNRRLTAAQVLNNLGESSTLNRLEALSTTGALPRQIRQMQNTAAYNALMQQIMFPYQQGAQVAGTLKGNQAVVQTPSVFQQAAPLVGAAVGAMI